MPQKDRSISAPSSAPNGAKARKALHFDARVMLTALGAGRLLVRHAPNEIVFRQGEAADAVFFIETGKINLSIVSDEGKERTVATLGAGDFFGEGCLAGQPRHIATAMTTAESEIVKVEKAAMQRMLHEQPEFSEMFMDFLLSRNIRIEEDLVDQLFNSSEKRLARILLLLANFGKEGEMEVVIPKISQEALAARVGTTRSRVNHFMNKFRTRGLIDYNGHLKVHSALLNVIVHD